MLAACLPHTYGILHTYYSRYLPRVRYFLIAGAAGMGSGARGKRQSRKVQDGACNASRRRSWRVATRASDNGILVGSAEPSRKAGVKVNTTL